MLFNYSFIYFFNEKKNENSIFLLFDGFFIVRISDALKPFARHVIPLGVLERGKGGVWVGVEN